MATLLRPREELNGRLSACAAAYCRLTLLQDPPAWQTDSLMAAILGYILVPL